jgi:U5 small nuclear ribonucleoprotein component
MHYYTIHYALCTIHYTLEEPIIKPIKAKVFSVLQKEPPALVYEPDFLTSLMNTPTLIRNIAVLGAFHHGKTMLVDTLVRATHAAEWDPEKEVRYMYHGHRHNVSQ